MIVYNSQKYLNDRAQFSKYLDDRVHFLKIFMELYSNDYDFQKLLRMLLKDIKII